MSVRAWMFVFSESHRYSSGRRGRSVAHPGRFAPGFSFSSSFVSTLPIAAAGCLGDRGRLSLVNGNDPLDQAIYETCHGYTAPGEKRASVKALARVMGMRPSTLQNKANPFEEYAQLSVKEARQAMLVTGDHRILHALARDVGEACFPLPSAEWVGDMDVMAALTKWQAEIGKTAQEVHDTYADGKVETHEIEAVERSLIRDYERGMELIALMKGQAEPESQKPALKAVGGATDG